ncbi:MAG TPA: hypothetical protein DCE44_23835, partial [Verrucomicrobiales bacterium]|nr:hypothetical protein [Verrucomicrobiales bacterium]
MKTYSAFLAGLAATLGTAATALAAPVTFQVNMSAQISLGNFSPTADSLFVAGDPVNGWSTTESPLAASTGDPNIWTGTFDVVGTAGTTAQYKFLITTSSGTTWEGVVGPGGPDGNRTFTLSDTEQTLPVVYFNNVTSGSTVSSDVTFQVDMSVQATLGNFDPESGTVSVAGEFNSWNTSDFPLTRDGNSPNLWVGTRQLTGPNNGSVLYKFVMNGSSWEGNVGPNGTQNRSLTLQSTAQTLPVVFFNNQAVVPANIPITFQLNLGVQIAQGNFDPDTGTVSVAGDPLNNWNTEASVLTRNTTDPNLWTGTFEVNSSAGAVMSFKYVLNGSTWEGNVGPDGAQNRSYTFTSTDPQTLPQVYFNNVDNLGPIT